MLCEKRDGFTSLSSTACTTDTVDVVLDSQRELIIQMSATFVK